MSSTDEESFEARVALPGRTGPDTVVWEVLLSPESTGSHREPVSLSGSSGG